MGVEERDLPPSESQSKVELNIVPLSSGWPRLIAGIMMPGAISTSGKSFSALTLITIEHERAINEHMIPTDRSIAGVSDLLSRLRFPAFRLPALTITAQPGYTERCS